MHQEPVRTKTPKPVRSLTGGGKYLFRIDVEGWNVKKWGPPPYFGRVWADNEYWASYEAYDRLKFPYNATFKPKPVKIKLEEKNPA